MSTERLSRNESDKMIAGICGGIANYINIDSVLVRALFFFLIFASGIGILIYMILWFIMPLENNLNSSGIDVIQDNIEEMGQTVTNKISQLRHPGPSGILLILLGAYFLLNQMGLLHWLSGGIFWPLLIIGFGIYMLIRRNQS